MLGSERELEAGKKDVVRCTFLRRQKQVARPHAATKKERKRAKRSEKERKRAGRSGGRGSLRRI